MLTAPETLVSQGHFHVREDDGGFGTVVRVPEPDAGDETPSCISVLMPAQRCLETRPAHTQGMTGIQQLCCLLQLPVCLLQSKCFLFQMELCSQPEKCQLRCFAFTHLSFSTKYCVCRKSVDAAFLQSLEII